MTTTSGNDREIADYLRENPEFFVSHPELLATLTVPALHGGRAISLHERQLEVLREKLRVTESKISEIVRIGRENDAIADKMQRWTRQMLIAADPSLIPQVVVDGMQNIFSVPQVALRIWGVRAEFSGLTCAAPIASEEMALASSMKQPYCGPNAEFGAASWLPEAGTSTRSLALVPLRRGVEPDAFGMLVLGSADPSRFDPEMGTAFLERIAELASAALFRLIG
ncbi:MAG: DUF484 family protein [Quisquiliibacterium sp.]